MCKLVENLYCNFVAGQPSDNLVKFSNLLQHHTHKHNTWSFRFVALFQNISRCVDTWQGFIFGSNTLERKLISLAMQEYHP